MAGLSTGDGGHSVIGPTKPTKAREKVLGQETQDDSNEKIKLLTQT
jgi:hypothetical protein